MSEGNILCRAALYHTSKMCRAVPQRKSVEIRRLERSGLFVLGRSGGKVRRVRRVRSFAKVSKANVSASKVRGGLRQRLEACAQVCARPAPPRWT